MHKEVSIPFSDLRRVSVECGDCRTVITVDLEEGPLDVTQCPSCRQELDGVRVRLRALALQYREQKEARHKFSFRVTSEG